MKTPIPTVTVSAGAPVEVAPGAEVSVETHGYTLRITRNETTYDAIVTKPNGRGGTHLYRWPHLAAVYESLGGYFLQWGLPHVWTALKAALEAEMSR